jgi:hypothetical protein
MTRLAIRGWGRVTPAGDARHIGPIRAVWPAGPARIERLHRTSALALVVAAEALARAAPTSGAETDLGVFLGTALGCADVNDQFHRGLVTQGMAGTSPRLFAQTIPSGPAGEVAIVHRALGHSVTVMTGRASGLAAVLEARRALVAGRCEAALVLAGDVFGDDRAALLARGQAATACASAAREAMIALFLEDAAHAKGPATAYIECVALAGDEAGAEAAADSDWLGASGLVELTRWLDDTSPTFDVTISGGGNTGRLRASRSRSRVP